MEAKLDALDEEPPARPDDAARGLARIITGMICANTVLACFAAILGALQLETASMGFAMVVTGVCIFQLVCGVVALFMRAARTAGIIALVSAPLIWLFAMFYNWRVFG